MAEFRESSKIGANYTKFPRLYITQHELCETRVIRAYLGSLLVLEKTPDGARFARN